MSKIKWFIITGLLFQVIYPQIINAQTVRPQILPSPTPVEEAVIVESDLTNLTQKPSDELKAVLDTQKLGPVWQNPVKYAIRSSVEAGIPTGTIVLLLLLPLVVAIIAAARHIIGLRGFGIFLPASLAVTFVAIGPIVGIGLFITIIFLSTTFRFITRKVKIKLQYLPRMAMLLLVVVLGVLGVLFIAPLMGRSDFSSVSIFPVLILVLLAEDFSKVQLGKSLKVALNLTIETLILALISYVFLTLKSIQEFALLNPEVLLLSVFVFDFAVGKYVGLRFVEYLRFKKLISS